MDDPVEIQGIEPFYEPGQVVAGTGFWNTGKASQESVGKLFWVNEGRGDRDGKVVGAQRIDQSGGSGAGGFRFTLTVGPLSVYGKLIARRWAVEAIGGKGGESARVTFGLHPEKREVVIG